MTVVQPPFLIDGVSTSATVIRQAIATLINSAGGLVGPESMKLAQKGTPDMHVILNGGTLEEGAAWVPGTVSSGIQGLYLCYLSADFELPIPASDATNPRIETIVARVFDADYEGTKKEWEPEALKGTAEAGATLGNRKGAAAVPHSCLVLGYVLVPAKATSIITADIETVAQPFKAAGGGGRSFSWGRISAAGAIEAGSGDFTVAKIGTGEFEIKWTVARSTASYAIQVTPIGTLAAVSNASGKEPKTTSFVALTFGVGGGAINTQFSFLVLG